jgi:hypothetical protein
MALGRRWIVASTHRPSILRSLQLQNKRIAPWTRVLNIRYSSVAADHGVPSFLLRSGVDSELFVKFPLKFEDHIELYTKRLRPVAREIRLLFILPTEDDRSPIELLMVHCLLEAAPPYLALSYTGGHPFASSKSHEHKKDCDDEWYDAKHSVLVNGITLDVKKNLYQALRKFRKSHASIPVWIDSICMNEGDPIERPEQIRMMGDIYGQAEEVLIWLGEVESMTETKTAMDMITGIVDNFKIWYDEERPPGFDHHWAQMKRKAETTPDSVDQKLFWRWLQTDCKKWFEGLDLKKLNIRTDARACDALRRLLEMRWFSRVWTWQEKEVAKKATVYIGDTQISWERLRLSMLLFMAHDMSDSRLTSVRILPGREYLRVLDSLNIADSPDLLDIVMNVRHRETHHRRDKIFGALGASARYKLPVDTTHFFQLLNYGYLKTPELYKEFARYWIQDKQDLRLLQACNPGKKRIEELPSWVADWSDTTTSHQLTTRLYTASRRTKVDVKFYYHKNSNEIQLRGIPIDTIKTVYHDKRLDNIETNLMNQSTSWDPYSEALIDPYASLYIAGLYPHLTRWLLLDLDDNWLEGTKQIDWKGTYLPTGEPTIEAFWRTLLVDHDQYAQDSLNRRIPLTTDVSGLFDFWAHRKGISRSFWPRSVHESEKASEPANIPEESHHLTHRSRERMRWREKLQNSILHKRFFVTERGFIGVAPSNVKVGDMVCVFFGGHVPFGLRAVEGSECFELVEEIYLHGFMDGKAVDMAHKGELEERYFRIQ